MASYDHNLRNYLSALLDFRATARATDVRVDVNFQNILRNGQKFLGMSEQQLGDALSVSRPTINRWINGKNLPYMAMRKPVIAWIDEEITGKIKILEKKIRTESAIPNIPRVAGVKVT